MAGLFQGTPQQATSYTTSSTETPKWMQDAIYNQIQLAQGVANTPYQPYSLPTVAELSPLQQQAYQQVQTNQGAWQPAMNAAQTGTYGATTGTPTATAAQGALGSQQTILNNLNAQYTTPGETLTPYVQQATSTGGATAAAGSLQNQQQILANLNNYYDVPYEGMKTAAQQAVETSGVTAAQPYLTQAGQSSVSNIGVHTLVNEH